MTVAGEWPKVAGDEAFAADINEGSNVIAFEAGEAITAGNVVYIHLTSGTAFVSDTGTANDIRANGIALNTAALAASVSVMLTGVWTTSGLTAKEDYYLGTAGAVSTTVSGVRIGTALSTTKLAVNIVQDDRDIVGTIKPYLKAHAGTVPAITAFWKACDGSLISDTESPINNAGAGEAPNLNATLSFIRGNTTSDNGTDNTVGGTTAHNHTPGSGSPFYTGVTDSQPNASHIPTFVSVFWIMKIK